MRDNMREEALFDGFGLDKRDVESSFRHLQQRFLLAYVNGRSLHSMSITMSMVQPCLHSITWNS